MKFHQLLDKHDFYKKLLTEAAEERVLFFSPQSSEVSSEKNESGVITFHREGLSSEDINGYYSPSLKEYIEGNIKSYKEGVELYKEFIRTPKTKLEKIYNVFLNALAYVKAVSFIQVHNTWSYWIWVLDSSDTIPFDIVIETHGRGLTKEEYDEKVKKVTRDEILAYLNKHYVQVSPSMWVSSNDPGCMIYDNLAKPYALKDGWSNSQVAEILSEWAEVMTGDKITADVVLSLHED